MQTGAVYLTASVCPYAPITNLSSITYNGVCLQQNSHLYYTCTYYAYYTFTACDCSINNVVRVTTMTTTVSETRNVAVTEICIVKLRDLLLRSQNFTDCDVAQSFET